ncbi:hypothetical protein [Actinomycetospora chibensis]|uniref:Uncharacterized protein n=1 Tax=Actinomycetospora chibensis TaxID=663606 RepID=A0ABV9RL41_9PSEU|nr:hypothetical protein [Actinomycetospora chibensis]MDD7925934.1 hypothetical protein [Actinomycetospora chibensis]
MRARRGTADILREAARGVVCGAVGTGAMALTARLHRELHARRHGIRVDEIEEIEEILDYDDSEHVVIAASTLLQHVIGWAPRSERGRRTLFWLVHWGYGSTVGVGHLALRRVLGREPGPGLAFFAGCQTMALGLFPVLGETPPPWRWERHLLVTSTVQHAVYAGGVAAANTATARLVDTRSRRRGWPLRLSGR